MGFFTINEQSFLAPTWLFLFFWQKMKGFAYLVFPNSIHSVLPEGSLLVEGEAVEHGIITSVTHGLMSGTCYPYHVALVEICNVLLLLNLWQSALSINKCIIFTVKYVKYYNTSSHNLIWYQVIVWPTTLS